MSEKKVKKRGFLKDSSIYLTATCISTAIAFITLPIYTRYLSPADFGIVALFGMFGMVISGLISIGIKSATYRYYFQYKRDHDQFTILNSTNLVFLFGIFLLSGLCIYHLAPWFSSTIFNGQISAKLIRLSFLSGCINYIFMYLTLLLTAQAKSRTYAGVAISRALISTGFSFYFIFMYSLTYMARIYAIILTQTIMVIWLLFFFRGLIRFRFSTSSLKKSLKFTYPLVPQQIIGLVHKSFDKILLSNFTGLNSVGYYTLGAQFATSIKLVMDSLTKVWSPFFFNKAHENTREAQQAIIRRFYELAFFIMFGGLGIIYFSEELVTLLTTKEFYPVMYVVPIYVYFYLFGILGMLTVPQMMFAEKLYFILPASIISVILNVLLNILFIPKFGAVGAAIATAIAALVSGIIMLYFGQRVYPLQLGLIKLGKLFLLIMVFTALVYPIMMTEFNLILKIAIKLILLSVFFGIGIKLDYISKKKIKNILSRIFYRDLKVNLYS